MKRHKQLLGSVEHVQITAVCPHPLKARVDTGAATSALHCKTIRAFKDTLGVPMVGFVPLDDRYPQWQGKEVCLPVVQQRTVKSSSGHRENRYFVRLEVSLGKRTLHTLFSLTDRKHMNYPVLLGRTLLRRGYLVDVSQKFLADL
ncbi:MAG: RimK/LysX family protein [Bacteroidetes bacterium]|nr:RimK/LysX family protein [Bacteroidota bacterium]